MSGKYIVVFKDHVSDSKINNVAADITTNGGVVGKKFESLLKGFSAEIPEGYLTQLQSLQGGDIDYIEPDGPVHTQ
ncbi:Serine proteinase inhibitor IA-2 [Sparassis crispa]|uniref:Serine proteinase inhibitor IA-2 n=1 Tax=Sparassis crispa TaxID=139825 RepID=A0A401GG79_9APHY|nr:Serine proteinase inhibitor IA-2 [Sparassis crispa]GBE81188.1 Serine proteinase inhibitor IA-2 [Sparassis crispa]